MNKKIIANSIVVLSIITVVCVAILAVVNDFWKVTDEERFARAVSNLMQADSFEILYDGDNVEGENYSVVAEFNSTFGGTDHKVNKVRLAKGGRDDGYILFESTGRGYKQKFVKVFIGYDKEGKITGVSLSDISTANNLVGYINWSTASSSLRDKDYQTVIGGGSDIIANTGATLTLDGVAEAINISNQFYKNIILGVEEKAEVVTDTQKIAQLNKLFEINQSEYNDVETPTQYVRYPIRTSTVNVLGGSANVEAVYYADETYVILEVNSSGGSYGNWTLLILLHNEKSTIAAINPIYSNNTPYEDIDASKLVAPGLLTSTFKDIEKEDIADMDKFLHGTTGATNTNVGLKAGVYHALDQQDQLRQELAEYIAKEENNG